MEQQERVLNWDDEIEYEGAEYILLKEGEYDFTVSKFERGRHDGSDKLPACNKAILTLKVETPEGPVTITHNLFLHTKCEGLLSAFFISIGQKKHGEKLRMNWQMVVGAKGRAKIGPKTYNDKQYNEIKSFLEPSNTMSTNQTAAPTPSYTAGQF